MKLSIFTTVTNPQDRGDNAVDALNCYDDLADELVVVNGGDTEIFDRIMKGTDIDVYHHWPKEFDWPFIGQQFQRGYEACTGDVVLHMDLDFIFHENDFGAIRKACEQMVASDAPAMSFWKHQFILPDRYNLKSRLVTAVNKAKFGDKIKFDSSGDLCQPSLDGQELKPSDVPEARVPFYNYEKLTKTKAQIINDVGRMDRAYKRHFGKWLYSTDGTDESAYEGWLQMSVGRFGKPQKHIKLNEHPKYIQDTIKNLTPEQFGYSMFGIEENDYVKNRLHS